MDTENELNNVICGIVSNLHKVGYRFPEPDGSMQTAAPNAGKKDMIMTALIAASVGFSFGLVGVLSLGGDELTEDVLQSELKDIASCGLMAGFKRTAGMANVAVLVDCTGISDETLIGKLSVIEAKLKNFKKFSLRTTPQVRFIKYDSRGVFCYLYLLFTEQHKTDYFLTSIWGKHFKRKFFSNVLIYPIVVDVKDKRLFKYKGPLYGFSKSEYTDLAPINPD